MLCAPKKSVAKATLRLGNIGRASNGIFIVHASKKHHHLILDDFLDAVRSKRIQRVIAFDDSRNIVFTLTSFPILLASEGANICSFELLVESVS